MHLDQEQLQRLLHGELSAAAEAAARQHLTACSQCRKEFEDAQLEEADVNAMLQQLDHPPPRVQANSIAGRARQSDRSRLRWAAGVVITFGVVAGAYALPGSPLRSWIKAMVRPAADQPLTNAAKPELAGIVVEPGDEFLIEFGAAQNDSHAIVALTDSSYVTVRVVSGVANFTSDERRLLIDNQGSPATLAIDLPRSTPRVEIRVAGRRVFLKQGAVVNTATAPDANGRYQVSLSQTTR